MIVYLGHSNGHSTMHVLAIDLGGSHATCALLNDRQILSQETIQASADQCLASLLPHFARTLQSLCDRANVHLQDCAGVVLGFCGLADFRSGRVLATNQKYNDAPSIDLPSWAQGEFGLPFRIENDARLALLGERYAGAAQGLDDIVMITIGTGIGGAAMMCGKLVRGKHAQAGCLGGHLAVNPRGRPCTCGATGCAESEASTWALPSVCSAWPGFKDSRLAHESTLDFAKLFRLAEQGDTVASEVADYCVDVWSSLAVSLVHAYDPEAIVIGGGVMRSADRVLPAIRRRVQENAWTPWGKVAVLPAQCGEQAALLGATPLFMGMA